jgi:6-phosphogluconolactonase
MELKTFSDFEEFVNASSDYIANIYNQSGEVFRMALSGGSTPGPVYKKFAQRNDIDISKVELFQVDERYVDENNAASNLKLIKDTFKNFKIHYFDTSKSIEEAVSEYSKELEDINFDLTILGIGADGHFASIFPGGEEINEQEKTALHTTTKIHDIKDRLTITIPVIMSSMNILVLLKGESKRFIIDELRNPTKSIGEFPANALLKHNNLTIYFSNM